jgi:hypothetical protein
MTLSWSVWVLAGFALTYALWRSAALARPDKIRAPHWWTYLAKVGGIILAIALLHLVIQPTTPAYPLAMIGFLWIAMALLRRRWSRFGKTIALAIGALVIAGGLAVPLLASGMDDMMLTAALLGGIIPTVGGFYQTLRG